MKKAWKIKRQRKPGRRFKGYRTKKQIDDYVAGERKVADLKSVLRGTMTHAEYDKKYGKTFLEDAGVSGNNPVACNAAGGGKIAGIGIGADGEPPVRKKKKLLRDIIKRKM